MKKQFLTVAVAALALAGCSKNETVEVASNRAIGFESFVGKSTRVTTDVTLANLGSIEVYGWRTKDAKDEQIFKAQEVTVATDGKGTYSPLQYWEAKYTYNFEAIAPKHDGTKVNFAAAKAGGTIAFTNDGVTDLLYAKATEVTMGDKIESAPAPVGFTFKHLLSRVKFTFENGFPAGSAPTITVNNVKIANTITSGNIIPATSDWTDNDTQTKELTFPSDAVKNIVAQAQGASEHMYMIPGTEKTYNITFDVILTQGTVSTTYNHTVSVTLTLEKGNSYNLTATLNAENVNPETQMYPIEFTAKVEDWKDFGDVTVDVPTVRP